ncbi:unnamed protein product [Staurois parvus]|uniref:Uncharacterized protein n=1 Tax=Staurois parvus TaxID=386267 RepID=A0ABN9ARN7_9NEOB|nr:unnamed protein product [Staurois parvus]
MAEWEQWEAVQGPRSHCGPSSSVTRRYGGPWQIWGWQHLWEACNLPATYAQNGKPQECEETSKWHMAEWEQWEAVQGPRSHCGTSISSMRSRYGGPWQITCLAAAMGGP